MAVQRITIGISFSDRATLEKARARATALRMPLSRYVQALIHQDLQAKGRPLRIVPDGEPHYELDALASDDSAKSSAQ